MKMIRALSDCEKLEGLTTRGQIYSVYFTHLLAEAFPKGETDRLEKYCDRLGEVALELLEEGISQRIEEVETDYSKDRLKKEGDDLLMKEGTVPPELEKILQQTPGRWQFRHPSFQEFFAARALAKKADWKKTTGERCRDERWEEMLKFFSGMVPANEIFDIFMKQGALFWPEFRS